MLEEGSPKSEEWIVGRLEKWKTVNYYLFTIHYSLFTITYLRSITSTPGWSAFLKVNFVSGTTLLVTNLVTV